MLTKADDFPVHQLPEPIATSGTDRNFYDRYFFNGYSADGEVFFALALGVYPHLNVMDASLSVIEGGVQHNLRGSIAMAHGDDPNSATAEFFIETRDLPTLDPAPGNTGFAVFGQVTSGMDVVDQIAKAQLGGSLLPG